MNKPAPPPIPDEDVGPLDEHGQQIWSPEEEAAIARLQEGPAYWASIAEADADIAAGRVFTTGEVKAHMAEVKRRWRSKRGLD